VPTFFARSTSACASRKAMYAAPSFSAAPGAVTEPINGPSFARVAGSWKSMLAADSNTVPFATR